MLAPKTPRVQAAIMAVGSSRVNSFTWGRRQEAGGTEGEGGRRERMRRRQEAQKEKEVGGTEGEGGRRDRRKSRQEG